MLKENNVRKGFVEDADFDNLCAATEEPWLRAFLEVAYTYGWRLGELLGLRVRNLNFTTRTIRLDVGTTKNGEGREVEMTARVFELLKGMAAGKKAEEAVFTRRRGNVNVPVREMRRDWAALIQRAGLPGLLVHDLRRSCVKAMTRAGIPQAVAMKVTGHKTDSMYRRYFIVSTTEQHAVVEALEKAAAARAEAAAKAIVPQTVPLEGSGSLATAPVATKQVQ
jgi:integrase